MGPDVIDDCCKCKHFEECYYMPSGNDEVWQTLYKYLGTLVRRDMCVNNEKKDFESKD